MYMMWATIKHIRKHNSIGAIYHIVSAALFDIPEFNWHKIHTAGNIMRI